MIDLHAHILPGVDDGSRDEAESLALLKRLAAQQVTTVAATPHFYADRDTPEAFLARRQAAYERLQRACTPELPQVLVGAEVCYYRGVSNMQQLPRLCLADSGILLLELPFVPWSNSVVDEVVELAQSGFSVVLAHVERYFSMQSSKIWSRMAEQGIFMQSNAEALLHWRTAHSVFRMIHAGKIQFLASDCHNLHTRPPKLDQASARMARHFGQGFTDAFFRAEASFLEERGVELAQIS